MPAPTHLLAETERFRGTPDPDDRTKKHAHELLACGVSQHIGDYYGLDVQNGDQNGRRFAATGNIFRRDTQRFVHTVYGEGGSREAARQDCVAAAHAWARGRGEPEGWDGSKVLP